jgi:hypothetical protein
LAKEYGINCWDRWEQHWGHREQHKQDY